MMDPTSHVDTDLLEYARHYGIAEDPMSKSPDSYLTDSGLDNLFPDPAPANPQPLRERYEELDSQLGHYLNNEKLDISIHEGRLLTSVRRLELDGLQLDWNEMLPPLQSIGSLRQEPLLKTQVEEERAREIRGRGAMELVNVDTSPDQPTSMELGKTSGTADGSPNCSRQSSVRLVQSQSNGRASHNSAAFVGTVLSISKVTWLLYHNYIQLLTFTDRERQDTSPQQPGHALPFDAAFVYPYRPGLTGQLHGIKRHRDGAKPRSLRPQRPYSGPSRYIIR